MQKLNKNILNSIGLTDEHAPEGILYPISIEDTFGLALTKAIKHRGYKQKEIAKKLEISQSQISNWKKSNSIPHQSTINKIEEVLKDVMINYDGILGCWYVYDLSHVDSPARVFFARSFEGENVSLNPIAPDIHTLGGDDSGYSLDSIIPAQRNRVNLLKQLQETYLTIYNQLTDIEDEETIEKTIKAIQAVHSLLGFEFENVTNDAFKNIKPNL